MWRGAHKPPAHRKRLRRRQPRPRRQRLRRGARLPLLQRRAMGRRHHHQPTIRSSAGVRRAGTKDDPHRTEGSHVPEAHLPRRTGTSRAVPPYPPHPRMGQPITTDYLVAVGDELSADVPLSARWFKYRAFEMLNLAKPIGCRWFGCVVVSVASFVVCVVARTYCLKS